MKTADGEQFEFGKEFWIIGSPLGDLEAYPATLFEPVWKYIPFSDVHREALRCDNGAIVTTDEIFAHEINALRRWRKMVQGTLKGIDERIGDYEVHNRQRIREFPA